MQQRVVPTWGIVALGSVLAWWVWSRLAAVDFLAFVSEPKRELMFALRFMAKGDIYLPGAGIGLLAGNALDNGSLYSLLLGPFTLLWSDGTAIVVLHLLVGAASLGLMFQLAAAEAGAVTGALFALLLGVSNLSHGWFLEPIWHCHMLPGFVMLWAVCLQRACGQSAHPGWTAGLLAATAGAVQMHVGAATLVPATLAFFGSQILSRRLSRSWIAWSLGWGLVASMPFLGRLALLSSWPDMGHTVDRRPPLVDVLPEFTEMLLIQVSPRWMLLESPLWRVLVVALGLAGLARCFRSGERFVRTLAAGAVVAGAGALWSCWSHDYVAPRYAITLVVLWLCLAACGVGLLRDVLPRLLWRRPLVPAASLCVAMAPWMGPMTTGMDLERAVGGVGHVFLETHQLGLGEQQQLASWVQEELGWGANLFLRRVHGVPWLEESGVETLLLAQRAPDMDRADGLELLVWPSGLPPFPAIRTIHKEATLRGAFERDFGMYLFEPVVSQTDVVVERLHRDSGGVVAARLPVIVGENGMDWLRTESRVGHGAARAVGGLLRLRAPLLVPTPGVRLMVELRNDRLGAEHASPQWRLLARGVTRSGQVIAGTVTEVLGDVTRVMDVMFDEPIELLEVEIDNAPALLTLDVY